MGSTSEVAIGRSGAAGASAFQDRAMAWLLESLDGYMHRKYGALKRELFGDLPRQVLESGAGAGANFRYLARGTSVIALEPNRAAHPRLRAAAERHGLELHVREGVAEEVPLPDASVDAVISSLVLCTVASPERAVAEIRRVLRPGGRFWCLEHVAAPEGGALGRLQRAVRRPWRHLFGGCEVHRDTAGVLRRAGFASLELRHVMVRSAFVPIWPHLVVVAVR